MGFDYGIEQESPETRSTKAWYSPVIIARFVFGSKVAVAVRGEYYSDDNRIIIREASSNGMANGFKTTGVSANLDYEVRPNVVCRFDVRSFASQNEIFAKEGEFLTTNTAVSTSLAISF